MAYLELKNVSYVYPNGYTAVEDVSMAFKEGEAVAIIGQNGAGKTTTVKLMNGLLRPSKGEILVEGESTENKTTASIARKVGYVFQNPDDQIFQESIYKEIAYGLVKQKMSHEEVKRRALEAARLCGLEEDLEEHPYNLPYSKRKFITIAAIVAMDPKVVILDEPTAGQDRASIQLLGDIVHKLAEKNKIVITITHDMEFVVKYFKRVIVMAEKKVRRDGGPREIFWDEELLRFSSLKQPYLCQLANLLGYRDILTIDELLEVDL
ncbi:MAG TPA: energy-coupling factor ABC transporter ATP-binding protein [Candidatus Blautia ornithocaccae]|nr:energy-coupling factor ABC transporter ATP-binding protein [Candidatus Blautia ornithocaccae]